MPNLCPPPPNPLSHRAQPLASPRANHNHISYQLLFLTLMSMPLLTGALLTNAATLQKRDFSIQIPEEWREIPREVLGAMEDLRKEIAPLSKGQRCDYGFQLGESKGLPTPPLVLIHVQRVGRFPQAELDRLEREGYTFDEAMIARSRKGTGHVVSNIQVGKMVYDKQAGIIWLRGHATVNPEAPTSLSVLSATIPTEEGVILVNCASDTPEYGRYEPVFESIARSIAVMPTLAYKPRPYDGFKRVKGLWDIAAETLMLSIAIALFSGVVALLRKISKKKHPPSNEAPE